MVHFYCHTIHWLLAWDCRDYLRGIRQDLFWTYIPGVGGSHLSPQHGLLVRAGYLNISPLPARRRSRWLRVCTTLSFRKNLLEKFIRLSHSIHAMLPTSTLPPTCTARYFMSHLFLCTTGSNHSELDWGHLCEMWVWMLSYSQQPSLVVGIVGNAK